MLCEAYADGDLSVDDAVAAAKAILQKNALGFYKLDEDAGNYTHSAAQGLPVVSRDLGTGAGEKSWKDDVGFFRLVWADGAGLRRCRVSVVVSVCLLGAPGSGCCKLLCRPLFA